MVTSFGNVPSLAAVSDLPRGGRCLLALRANRPSDAIQKSSEGKKLYKPARLYLIRAIVSFHFTPHKKRHTLASVPYFASQPRRLALVFVGDRMTTARFPSVTYGSLPRFMRGSASVDIPTPPQRPARSRYPDSRRINIK